MVRIKDRNLLLWVAASFSIAAYAFYFVYARGVDCNYDFLNYHFFTGYSFVHGRSELDIAPAALQSFLNPYWNAFIYGVNSLLPFPFNAWSVLIVQLLSIPPLLAILRELEIGFALPAFSLEALIAFFLCLAAPLWWSELGTSFSSSATAPLILTALWLTLRGGAAPSSAAKKSACLAGVLSGLATGLKFTNVIFAVALPFTLIPALLRGKWRNCLIPALAYASGAVIGYGLTGAWNIFLWKEWGSPFFPLFNSLFRSPYFPAANFRDERWVFHSLTEFVVFFLDVGHGTKKTSEVPFSDLRLVATAMGASLLGVHYVKNRRMLAVDPRSEMGAAAPAFLCFTGAAIILWALALAYQRYLIPVEICLGLVIWICVRRLVRPSIVPGVMLLVLIASLGSLRVPDWGHKQGVQFAGTGGERFGLQMPEKLATTPALYLVDGKKNTHILPFLHPDSRFLGMNFVSQIDGRLREAIKSNSLPLRILADKDSFISTREKARRLGAPINETTRWECLSIRDDAAPGNQACELKSAASMHTAIDILMDFRQSKTLPPEIVSVRGLSYPEAWGRWSDADEIAILLNDCLSAGSIKITVEARAFGPNINKAIVFDFGLDGPVTAHFSNEATLASLNGRIGAGCEHEIRVKIPEKTSPMKLGLSNDQRELGIGLVSMRLQKF